MTRVRLALAGDTMLGRGVAEALRDNPPKSLVSDGVVSAIREAHLFLLNLECCISERGEPWPDPRKPFFFRAPPAAVELLLHLGTSCVTLANNHALDFSAEALVDTIDLLSEAGVAVVGAGVDIAHARQPAYLQHQDFRLKVIALTDHPPEYAAGPQNPGVAYANLARGIPPWVEEALALKDTEATVVSPHWGPNMVTRPVSHVRRAAEQMVAAGASLIAGHSAHVFHGVAGRALFDLGDFLDDYAVDPVLRNDLGLLYLVDLYPSGLLRLEAVPLSLDFCHTRLASAEEAEWISRRFTQACAEFGTEVERAGSRLVVEFG